MLDNSYWQNPANLIQAPQPAALASLTVDDGTHTLTINPAAQYVVKVAAFDGQATTTQFVNTAVTSLPLVFAVPDQQFAHSSASNPQLSFDLSNQPLSPAGAVNLGDLNGLTPTSTITVYNYVPGEAYTLSTSLNLQFKTSYYQDSAGRGERWLYSSVAGTWYIIEPNGNFSKWNGGSSYTKVATLDFSYWNNPNLLINITDGQHVVAPTALTPNGAFTFADNANVLSFNTNGSVVGNFLVSVTASDTLSSTTHTFKLAITDSAPSFNLLTPGSTTISHTSSYNATVNDIGDLDDSQSAVTVAANVYPYVPGLAYELQQSYHFYTTGSFLSSGTNPKWVRSAVNNGWYTIDKTGVLSKWNGGQSFTAIGTLDTSYYADPTKLFGATQPTPLNPASVTVTLTGSNAAGYNLNVAPTNAAGKLLVQVNASDGGATSSQYFPLTVVSPVPTFTVSPSAAAVAFTNPATATISNISAAPDPVNAVTFAANVYSLVPGIAYQLNQQKSFVFSGSYYLNSAGKGEKWLLSSVENAWYIIEPDGKLSKWNGGSSFTQVVIDGFSVVLGAAYWNDPTLLSGANTAPSDLAHGGGTFTTSFAGSNATGLTLTVNTNGVNQGTFLVQVIGNDSGATASQYFVQQFTDFAPTFGQPADQSISHFVHSYTLDLTNPAAFANPSAVPAPTLFYVEAVPPGNLATVTLGAKAYYDTTAAVAYQLNSGLNLFTTGNYYLNSAKLGEKWVRSHVTNLWYIIQPNGNFSVWNGGSSFTSIAQLDGSYFADPNTLFTATEPIGADLAQAGFPTPAVTSYSVDNVNHTVTVNTTSSFLGTLLVKVTASDPAGLSSSQFFKLTFTSLTPTLSFIPTGAVPLSKSGTSGTVELVGNDPDSSNAQPLTYAVAFTDASARRWPTTCSNRSIFSCPARPTSTPTIKRKSGCEAM